MTFKNSQQQVSKDNINRGVLEISFANNAGSSCPQNSAKKVKGEHHKQ